MTHTPGPWEIAEDDANGQAVVRGEHTEIATCWHHCVGSLEIEMRANARLISAAPELLEALKEAKNGLRYWEPQTAYGASERARICALVDAAIAKAESRS